ncbi:hypothetical protein ACAW46_24300, partial [Escherichia coli]|uniref:hypothetical protein n=1 Tax=Escherichia coli TaxID=562 RepID=UPI003520CEA8
VFGSWPCLNRGKSMGSTGFCDGCHTGHLISGSDAWRIAYLDPGLASIAVKVWGLQVFVMGAILVI